MNKSKIANTVLAGVLALAVVGVSYGAYRQKVHADTIVPGYATLHLGLKITLPEADSIRMKAVAYPIRGGKKYYFKERDFTFENAGINTVEWYIRKIPADNYNVVVTSSSGALDPESQTVEMENDTIATRLKYDLFLGEPEAISSPEPSQEETLTDEELLELENQLDPTATSTPATTTSPELPVNVPPVPQLPTI